MPCTPWRASMRVEYKLVRAGEVGFLAIVLGVSSSMPEPLYDCPFWPIR